MMTASALAIPAVFLALIAVLLMEQRIERYIGRLLERRSGGEKRRRHQRRGAAVE